MCPHSHAVMLALLTRSPHIPKPMAAKTPSAYAQCKHLQALLLRDADDPQLKPSIRASLARAFCELEETKRILLRKPLPKSVDFTKLPKRNVGQRNRPKFAAIAAQADKESISAQAPPTPTGGEGASATPALGKTPTESPDEPGKKLGEGEDGGMGNEVAGSGDVSPMKGPTKFKVSR